ncbi:Tubby-related protein 3 [Nosema granulosis]|uniref:Tubby-related protein 3 n=1 Tax=Nosema granulosis TaxID=83296 RepID=A0A9P6GZ61_9MICR|nr:Tubby-related protein 3 [Nosema granulosis]
MNQSHTADSQPFYSNTTRTSPMMTSVNIEVSGQEDYGVDMESLILKPYIMNRTSRGRVVVEKGFYNTYKYENQEHPGRTLMYAYRRFCGFEIYKRDSEGDSYVGSLKSNMMGTYYTLKTATSVPLTIEYKTSWMKRKKPRTFTVLFYKNVDGVDISKYPIVMRNKDPFYNVDTNSYSLNFNGRVTTPSVKNFQLIHPLDPTYVTLTFGKTSDSTYILDHTYPLSAFYGFTIGLAALDKKLFCD